MSVCYCLPHNNGKFWRQHAIVCHTIMESSDVSMLLSTACCCCHTIMDCDVSMLLFATQQIGLKRFPRLLYVQWTKYQGSRFGFRITYSDSGTGTWLSWICHSGISISRSIHSYIVYRHTCSYSFPYIHTHLHISCMLTWNAHHANPFISWCAPLPMKYDTTVHT